MPESNRRQAERVPVGILAELQASKGKLTAQVRDLSRSGLRVRTPLADLDLQAPVEAEKAFVVAQVVFGERFAVSLNHDRLGSLLKRTVELTRVELPDVEEQSVDLCCRFRENLTDAEVELLEAHVPPIRPADPNREYMHVNLRSERVVGGVRMESSNTGPLSVTPPDGETPEDASRPRQRYRAFVSAVRAGAVQTFRCHTDLVTAVAVRIKVPRKGYTESTKTAAREFVSRYGGYLELRMTDDELDIWSGRVRVSGVELPVGRPEVMLVTLAFDRALALGELRSLGLVQKNVA